MKIPYSFSNIKKHLTSSRLLIFATLLALVLANSSARDFYFGLWDNAVQVGIGDFNLFSHHGETLSLMAVINDFMMAVFFFAVGLEIKREVLVGELSSPRKALLPLIGACGGMLVPVLFFLLCCPADPMMLRGAAIPMATDIAFSLGVLAAFGRRVPLGLKVFLAALAVADDLGGIIVIALFYSGHIALEYMLGSAICVAILLLANYRQVRSKRIYLLVGLALWYMMLNSGIHATIAGVIVAFCIPASLPEGTRACITNIENALRFIPRIERTEKGGKPVIFSPEEVTILRQVETASDRLISPLQDIEDQLHTPVNYFIVPLFAFANAGIDFSAMSLGSLFSGVAPAVFLGLIPGKLLGVLLFSWLGVRLGWVTMPQGVRWLAFAGVCMLCGIGFTVSMFIANLSYAGLGAEAASLLTDAKLGILLGSVASAVAGYLILHFSLPPAPPRQSVEECEIH